MKKALALILSLAICFVITCTAPLVTVTKDSYLVSSKDVKAPRTICRNQDSVVTISSVDGSIIGSAITMYKTGNEYYFATSFDLYYPETIYEVVLSDFTRHGLIFVGDSEMDGIAIFKSTIRDSFQCIANTEGNLKPHVGEKVNIYARRNFLEEMNQAHVNAVGICKNCGKETYKNYFYSRLTIEIESNFIGAGIFNLNNNLVGMITTYNDEYKFGVNFVDSNRILDMITKFVYKGDYNKNFVKYNLLNVSQLTEKEKYLYSIDEINDGVLVSSIHYINYFTLGLNQGMVIVSVNDKPIKNVYDFDYEITKYEKGSYLDLKVRTIIGLYRTIKVKI